MRKMKKLLAVILVICMAMVQTTAVFATESVSEQSISENAGPEETADETTVSSDDADPETVADPVDAGDAATDPAEDPAGDPVPAGEEKTEEENEEDVSADSLPFGLKGMPEGYVLSEKEMADKKELQKHDVAAAVDGMKAGVDYVEDEVIFTCFDEEYAKTVAGAYGGTLESCKYGVAVIKLDTKVISVADAVKAGENVSYALPPVNPNCIIKLEDPEVLKNHDSQNDELHIGIDKKKKVVDLPVWNYWSKKLNDPALDPAYTFYDPDAGITSSGYQWMHDMVGTYEAWNVTMGSSDVTVAVIDTGVCEDHEDLKGQVKDTVYVDDKENLIDSAGHGTHVAGIIAMKANNNVGGAGIAPKVKILSVPVFGNGSASNAYLARAINYVADGTGGQGRQAEVINMSLGGHLYNQTEQDACDLAHKNGVTICVSSGNDRSNSFKYPAGYNNVICVAAVDESGQRTDFSTFGPWVDIAAPGKEIFSTWNGHTTNNTTVDYTDYYVSWQGTSMATPVVAGVCALYISAMGKDKVTPDQVEAALKKSATKVSKSEQIGVGIVNAAAMMPDDDTAPEIHAKNKDGGEASFSSLSANDLLYFTASKDTRVEDIAYAFTLNGKDPVIKDGYVTEGYVYKEEISGADLINTYGVKPGEQTTVKVVRITGKGTASKIATQTLTVNGTPAVSVNLVTVDGPLKVAKGKSASYTAVCSPAYLKTKVTWSLEGSVSGVTINAKTGKVTVKKTASGSFTVVATAQDDGKAKGSFKVDIVEPSTGVSIEVLNVNEDVNKPVKDRKTGNIKSVRLYNVDINSTAALTENTIALNSKNSNGTTVMFSTSKPSVASLTRDSSGYIIVTGKKAGTAKITARATDGSGKKAVLTVKVIVPASKIEVFYNKKGQNVIGFGKSGSLKAALGAAYGKPSVKKPRWEVLAILGFNGTSQTDVTNSYKQYVKVSNGKVSISKKMKNAGAYDYYRVYVKATATDGTGWSDNAGFVVQSPAKKALAGSRAAQLNTRYVTTIYFGTDYGYDYLLASGGKLPASPVVKSSDPKVCNFVKGDYGGPSDIKVDRTNHLLVYYYTIYGNKSGKATMTFTTNDGTNKTAKTVVYVK